MALARTEAELGRLVRRLVARDLLPLRNRTATAGDRIAGEALVPWLVATEGLRIAEGSIASVCYRFTGTRAEA